MKEDFEEIKRELDSIGILRISRDFYMEPIRKGSNFFIKSPATKDRTASLCLYVNTNRYCDFAAGNRSGDIINFISYIKGVDNWQALNMLRDYYSLSGNREQRQDRKERIAKQQEAERRKAERQQAFRRALFDHISSLKRWEQIYTMALEKRLYEPFSELWTYCHDELSQIRYKLDILTAADQSHYCRMKISDNIPSDRPRWLLDVLAILSEDGVFTAIDAEMKEIKAQRDFELQRKPGDADRRCGINW